MTRTLVKTGLAWSLITLAACAVNPATGERQFSLVSESQEIAMGQQGKTDVEHSIGVVTALLPVIGYEKATGVAKEALATGRGVTEIVLERGWLTREQLDDILRPESMAGR